MLKIINLKISINKTEWNKKIKIYWKSWWEKLTNSKSNINSKSIVFEYIILQQDITQQQETTNMADTFTFL